MGNSFEVQSLDNCIVIRKEDSSFCMDKGNDGDIWFHSPSGNAELRIAFHSRREPERGCNT